jgi:small redox-active disulfide protein 2
LERVTHEAVDALGLTAEFEKVTDPADIASWGVMRTPALVVDDEVVLSGRVPSADDVKAILAR